MTKPGKRVGRPPQPVPKDEADDLIDWLSDGQTLASWCVLHKRCIGTIRQWREKDPSFDARYARAREDGMHVIADRLRTTAATPSTHDDDVAHRRLQIDVDKWLLARWLPSVYGDRSQVEHSGGVAITVTTGVPAAE